MVAGKVRTKLDKSGELVVFSEAAVRNNAAIVEYCRTSMAALSGGTAGLLGLTGFYGFGFYIFAVFGLWGLILMKAGSQWKKYFINRKSLLTNGFFGGLFRASLHSKPTVLIMFFHPINKRKSVVSLIIALIAVIGDKNFETASDPLAAAIWDNASHALIGGFTWLGITHKPYNSVLLFFEFFACAVLSSLIDADHFLAARSFHLKDATNLKSRPFLHCTTLAILIILAIVSLSYCLKMNWMYELGWILAAAFFSHHVRDSKRHGFWLWPFGSTLPTPYVVYILVQMFLPQILTVVISAFSRPQISKVEFFSSAETV